MPDTATNNSEETKLIRCCAIYTRKSHEEGLEQEFNSLDAADAEARTLDGGYRGGSSPT